MPSRKNFAGRVQARRQQALERQNSAASVIDCAVIPAQTGPPSVRDETLSRPRNKIADFLLSLLLGSMAWAFFGGPMFLLAHHALMNLIGIAGFIFAWVMSYRAVTDRKW